MNTEIKPPSGFQLFPGLWILLGVGGLIAMRLAWGWWQAPANFEQMAKIYSSIDAFQETPMVNHAGNLIGLIHNTPEGVGIFIANIKDRTEQKICGAKDSDILDTPRILGWSPDDQTFAYRWETNLYFLDKGTESPGDVPMHDYRSFAWLSPDCCVYVASDTNTENDLKLGVVQRQQGKWREIRSWPFPATSGKLHALLATGTNTVAWATGDSVFQMDVSSGVIQTLYAGQESAVVSLSYSLDTGKFLMVETAPRARVSSLSVLADGKKHLQPVGKVLITEAWWIDHGSEYVYQMAGTDNKTLIAGSEAGPLRRSVFNAPDIAGAFCNGDDARIYALAAYTNEAPSIWMCDANDGAANRLFSPWGFSDMPVHFQPALTGYAPMPNKHLEKFVLIPPAHFSRQKKYPLIIGMQGYDWMNVAHATYSQALANSGAYVALTGYHYTHQTDEELLDYTNNVLAVYDQMARNPNVDLNRVYLFAFSSSTLVVNHLIDDYPGRWRGIMLFNPTAVLPEAKTGITPPMVITAGSEEEWLWKQFLDYQHRLGEAAIPLNWHVHAGEGHIERSQETMYQRSLLMNRMVFNN